ncbi:S-adenosyl-L-methionine-dependent methyltransferase [Xylariales sp. PMI_506]|nr:S-adenosyl-L-methionine-dependent methyltransferase [Xylariales sp. PMI_506]
MPSHFTSTSDQWDRHVEDYAEMANPNSPSIGKLFNLAEPLRSISTATAILDDGCGTGNVMSRLIREYADKLPTGVRLIASDYSKGMVDYVRKRKEQPENASNPFWQRLETYVLDVQDLSPAIAPASLSHVFSNLVFMVVEDCPKPIKAAYEALEVGGVLAFTMLVSIEWIDIWRYAKEEVDPDGEEWGLSIPAGWRDQDNVEKLVKDAGFTTVQLERQELPMNHTPETLKAFLTRFINSSNPLTAKLFGDVSEEKRQKAVDLITESVVKDKGEEIVLKGLLQIVIAKK